MPWRRGSHPGRTPLNNPLLQRESPCSGISAGGEAAGGVSLLALKLLAGEAAGGVSAGGVAAGGVSLLAVELLAGSLYWRGSLLAGVSTGGVAAGGWRWCRCLVSVLAVMLADVPPSPLSPFLPPPHSAPPPAPSPPPSPPQSDRRCTCTGGGRRAGGYRAGGLHGLAATLGDEQGPRGLRSSGTHTAGSLTTSGWERTAVRGGNKGSSSVATSKTKGRNSSAMVSRDGDFNED
ncbi:unnamed protein product [Closterium sp. NIES-64]|nr:unnamed protein product [Closterium sp. NIES-64]